MRTSIAARANLDLIEENYRRWRRNPESVDSGWAAFFEGFELGEVPEHDGAVTKPVEVRESSLQSRVDGLVYAYRILGHTIARVNPLAQRRPENPLLTPRELGCSANGFTASIAGGGILRDVFACALRRTKAFLTARRGIADGDSRCNSAKMSRCRDQGDLHGHGAPRPSQCACEFSEKIAQCHLHRIQRKLYPEPG